MTLIKVKSRGTDNVTGRKNLLINGDMRIAQRGTSTSFAHDGTTSAFTTDRFNLAFGGTHEQVDGTLAQVANHPTSVNGKSLKWTTGTAESSYDADEYAYISQKIEAQNVQHLQYGNSNAQTITVSFYVKSSITGTYAVGLYKPDTTNRIFNKTYTISSANTWEKKTLTFVGDTDSGAAIVNDNGQGLWISWHLATGSNYSGGGSTSGWVNYSNDKWADGQATNAVMTTANATWQLTECQVEVGDNATDFEHRSFGEELSLCYRYYQKSYNYGSAPGSNINTPYQAKIQGQGYHFFTPTYPVRMRAQPTLTTYSNGSSGASAKMYNSSTSSDINSSATSYEYGHLVHNASSVSAGHNVGYHYTADAEL